MLFLFLALSLSDEIEDERRLLLLSLKVNNLRQKVRQLTRIYSKSTISDRKLLKTEGFSEIRKVFPDYLSAFHPVSYENSTNFIQTHFHSFRFRNITLENGRRVRRTQDIPTRIIGYDVPHKEQTKTGISSYFNRLESLTNSKEKIFRQPSHTTILPSQCINQNRQKTGPCFNRARSFILPYKEMLAFTDFFTFSRYKYKPSRLWTVL